MNLFKNQKGFAVFEAVLAGLLVIAIVGLGYFAYQARQDRTNYSVYIPHKGPTKTVTLAPSSSPSATPAPSTSSDTALVTAAATGYTGQNLAGDIKGATVSDIIGDNAHGTMQVDAGDGSLVFVAHKASGQWSIVYAGEGLPGNALGQQYGLPSGWYSTSY